MERYRNTYRSDSTRIQNWDYGSPGYYYVTICTKNKTHYFGEVVMCDGLPDTYGATTGAQPWEGKCGGIVGTHNYASLPPAAHPAHVSATPISHPYVFVRLTEFGKIAHQNWKDIPKHFPFVVLDEFVIMPNHIHGIFCFNKPGYRGRKVNSFGPQSQNLASVIRNFKMQQKQRQRRTEFNLGGNPDTMTMSLRLAKNLITYENIFGTIQPDGLKKEIPGTTEKQHSHEATYTTFISDVTTRYQGIFLYYLPSPAYHQ